MHIKLLDISNELINRFVPCFN